MPSQKPKFPTSERIVYSTMSSCSSPEMSSQNKSQSIDESHKVSSMLVLERKLENGLTVLLSPNSEEPRFYAEIITRAGSKHDPSSNTGLAHYLEHLLFKGTQNLEPLILRRKNPCLIKSLNSTKSAPRKMIQNAATKSMKRSIVSHNPLPSLPSPTKWTVPTVIWAARGCAYLA